MLGGQTNGTNDNKKYSYTYKIQNNYLTPEYMLPVKFIQINSFPKTCNGKIDRKKLPECVGEEYDVENNNLIFNTFSKIESEVIEIINSLIDLNIVENEIIDTDLVNLGFDSITFIKFILEVEEKFKIEFEDEMLRISSFSSIREMIRYIELEVDKQ